MKQRRGRRTRSGRTRTRHGQHISNARKELFVQRNLLLAEAAKVDAVLTKKPSEELRRQSAYLHQQIDAIARMISGL